ncbi:hypothetical protein J596_2730 [Acinetobacter baumannii 21072]|uniref:Phage abortive infection protein n=1 Tax=Acinetobacter baumannii 21072 TaxID=1310697 RepID=A0A062I8V2_ACIBA|nr:hypothetical protein [Acinetobacter baumannii]KCY17624.1 hypothetical protein J596_2730 [Acinetobacter baumannii 21072]
MPISLNKIPQKPIKLTKEKTFSQKIKDFCIENKFSGFFLFSLIVLTVWLFFPVIFSLFFSFILDTQYNYPDNLGGIGDIYGSLNTLFSLLTLLVVLYSNDQQIETNKEILRASNLQLNLARRNHKDQMSESRRAIFNDMFYSLLNYKSEKFKQLSVVTKNGTLNPTDLTSAIYKEFLRLVDTKWSNLDNVKQINLEKEFEYFVNKISNGKGCEKLYTYFYLYESIYKLINSEKLTDSDEHFYKDLVSNSMEVGEQVTLIWIAASSDYHCDFLKNSGIFTFDMTETVVGFADKFLEESLFSHPNFLETWTEYKKNKNPA